MGNNVTRAEVRAWSVAEVANAVGAMGTATYFKTYAAAIIEHGIDGINAIETTTQPWKAFLLKTISVRKHAIFAIAHYKLDCLQSNLGIFNRGHHAFCTFSSEIQFYISGMISIQRADIANIAS